MGLIMFIGIYVGCMTTIVAIGMLVDDTCGVVAWCSMVWISHSMMGGELFGGRGALIWVDPISGSRNGGTNN